jgi:uncharacterized protein YejL (UPF0352 family)
MKKLTKKEQEIVNEFIAVIEKHKHIGFVRLVELASKAFPIFYKNKK